MSPRSPVRIRMESSTGMTKMRPSPISPVWAALMMACTVYVLVSDDDGDECTFDVTRVIDNAAVDTSLPGLAYTSYVIVREPFDICFEKCFFHFFELGLANNSFNLFHNLKEFG